MSFFMGIDVGTSAVKAIVVDGREAVVAAAERPLETSRPRPGWSEQHPDLWWAAVRMAIADLRATAPEACAAVAAIGLSGQMHGAVLLDAGDRPLRPAILWNDGRAAGEAAALNTAHPELARTLGVPAMAGFLAPKIAWLRENEPDLFNRVAHVLLPKDWIRLKMTGDRTTDPVDAAGAWLFDEARRSWSEAAVAAVGLTVDALPRVLEGPEISGRLLPEIAAELGLAAGTPVVAGAGDAAAAAIGIGAVEEGDGFVSLGTSSQIFLTTATYRPHPERLVHAFAHALPGRWFQMAAMLNGASALAWIAGVVGASDIGGLLDEVEAGGRPVSPVTFLPYLAGERTPLDDPDARGVLFGMDGGTGRGDLVQAVIEGIAFSLVDGLAALEATGPVPDRLAAVGGGSRGAVFMRIVASALGRPIVRYEGGERGPAFGVARLARLAVTGEGVGSVCRKPPIRDVIEPDPARTTALAGRLPLYRDLYANLKPLFRRAAASGAPS